MGLNDNLSFGKKRKSFKNLLLAGLILLILSVLARKPIVNLTFQAIDSTQKFSQSSVQVLELEFQKLVDRNRLISRQVDKIRELEQELAKKEYQLQFLRASQNNYKKQFEIRKLKAEKFPRAIEAQVVSRSPNLWQQEVIISEGKTKRIQPGNVVITPKGVFGQVSKVYENFSVVELISSRKVRFGASVKRTGVLGVIFGDRPGFAKLKFVPIGSDVKVGDFIETTKTSPEKIKNLFPLFYPVGKVVSVNRASNNSELVVDVELAEKAFKLTDLLVVQPFD